jgi:hypothetical protein
MGVFCSKYKERECGSLVYQWRCVQSKTGAAFRGPVCQPGRDAKLLRVKSKDQSEDEQMLRRRQRNHARRDFRSPEKAATLSA